MRALLMAPPLSKPFLETRLRQVAWIDLACADGEHEAAAFLPEADILIMTGKLFGPAVFEAVSRPGSSIKWIQILTAGYDRIPIAEIPPSILLSSAGPALAAAVADHAMALLLALGRQLLPALEMQRSGLWLSDFKEQVTSLYGKTIAIVGFGPIGQEIAKRARGFDARIIAVSHRGRPSVLADEVHAASSIDDVLPRADAVIVALPLTAETSALFNAERFARCRPGTLFVNVGRGKTVDMSALKDALDDGRLAAAGLDVTDPEPLPTGHPLWTTRNLLITPHLGGGGGYARLADFVAENIERFRAGKELLSLIERGSGTPQASPGEAAGAMKTPVSV